MSRIDCRLLFVILLFGLLTAILSCSQPDDIVAPTSLTRVWISAERLPTPTPGMAYGLWVSKVAYPLIAHASEVRPLGQFSYVNSDTLVAFLEPDNTLRVDSNEFALDDDLFAFSYLFVTVESAGSHDTVPGPVMLMQSIRGDSDTLRLSFPQHDSLFDAIVRCNFESPTDGNRGYDGYGLWFSSYEFIRREIHDTNGAVVTYLWDTIHPLIGEDGDTLNRSDLYGKYPDTLWYEFDTVLIDFGRDTLALDIDSFIHHGAQQYIIWEVDSTIPRIVKDYDDGITLDTVVRIVYLDIFSQDLFMLPDLSPYGWKYKGWAVADHIPADAVGEFSPPAWDFITGELLIPGYQGGLLTTGTFTNELEPDDADPYTFEIPWEVDSGLFRDTVLKRPAFPGEDFLDSDSLTHYTNGVINAPFNLLPNADNSQSGSVFISMEPINMVTDTTNFPLIAFCRRFPIYWPNIGVGGSASWTLHNWTGSASGANGFPRIEVRIQRL